MYKLHSRKIVTSMFSIIFLKIQNEYVGDLGTQFLQIASGSD